MSDELEAEINKHLFKVAWEDFQYLASQRISFFRFYTIFFGLMTSGMSFLIFKFTSTEMPILPEIIGMIISISFLILSVLFILIDSRNCELIEFAKQALIDIENTLKNKSKLMIFMNETKESKRFKIGNCIKIIYSLGVLVSVVFFLIAFKCLDACC